MTGPEPTPDVTPEDAQHGAPAAGARPEPTVRDEPVREVFRRALRDMLVLVGALAVLGIGIGALVAEPASAGVWGAVLGVAVALVFSGSTVLAMYLTARSSLTAASGALVGTWLVKMMLLIIAFSVLRTMDFYDRGVFVVVVLVGVLGSVLLDYRAVSRARVPYVDPSTDR
jgi:hypothetical protein